MECEKLQQAGRTGTHIIRPSEASTGAEKDERTGRSFLASTVPLFLLATEAKAKSDGYSSYYAERNMDIESNNNILISRMVQSACHTMPSVTFLKESLNAPLRSRLEKAIDNDNQVAVHLCRN